MSDPKSPARSKFRTYAADLALARQQRQHGNTTATPPRPEQTKTKHPAKKPVPVPIAKAPTDVPIAPKITEDSAPKEKTKQAPKVAKKTKKETREQDHIAAAPKPSKQPTKIPAFHELQKDIASTREAKDSKLESTVKKEPAHKNKHKFVTPAQKRSSIDFDATIITDTKSHRFQLFPALTASIKNWLTDLKKRRTKKKTPTYSIPQTERRKGVIQKATSKSGTIFTADSETLREQIRRRRQQEAALDQTEGEEAETSWSPYTETGYTLLEAPDETVDTTQNVRVEYKRPISFTIPTAPAPVAPPAPEPEPASEPEPLKKEAEPTPAVPEIETDPLADSRWNSSHQENQPTSEPVAPPAPEPEPASEPEPLKKEAEPTPAVPEKNTAPTNATPQSATDQKRFFDVETNTLSVTIVLIVVAVVTTIFIGRIVMQQFSADETATEIAITSESILSNSEFLSITLQPDSLDQLPAILTDNITTAPAGLVEFAYVSPLGEEVTAPYLFSLLNLNTLPSFEQSITSVHFVSLNRAAPAVVFQFVDENTIRGGLLNWELTMATDLQALHEKDITAAEATFIDDTLADTDVRILRDEAGRTILVYGIVGSNTAVIAPSTGDFTQIVQLGLEQ